MSDASDREVPAPWPGRLLERARRLAPGPAAGNTVSDLIDGHTDAEIATRHGLPIATVRGVRSFYDQLERVPRACDGTACRFADGPELAERLRSFGGEIGHVRCLGHCYAAPSFQSGSTVYARPRGMESANWLAGWGEGMQPAADLAPVPRISLVDEPVILRRLIPGARPDPFEDYALPDGGTILAAVEAAKLRGRGGAAYPTAAKWRAARDTPARERFVVANGDEGDPGSFVDRLLLEEDPHAVLAGMLACARAIGARRGFLYIRAEYPRAQQVASAAIAAARLRGVLGLEFDVEVLSGAGSYVCGEETALLDSIEGRRGEPRVKPPYPAQSGLWGHPTVVQNVETLAAVPWAVKQRRATGTKAVSLAGALAWTGVAEIPLGISMREVLERAGGGPASERAWRMAVVGGPMGRVIPAAHFDVPLSYEGLPGFGHGGIVVLDERVSPRMLAEHLFGFARGESCGNCAPCRLGTAQLAHVRDAAGMTRLLDTLERGSLCGFGQGVPRPIRDLMQHWGGEVFA